MRITICGHAGLYIETSDQRILLDPYFADNLLGGALIYNPGRVLDINKMLSPTVLVVTHGHFDHFHLESLEKFPRDLPLLTADDPPIVKQLEDAGFSHIIKCTPWQLIKIGQTSFLATPSEHEEEEIGLLIRDEFCSFWHMADSEVSIEIGERIAQEYGSIDLISAKHQPSVRAMIGYLRNSGASFDKQAALTWLEAACICEPGLVFPYASGICFNGRHAWFNSYAFPLSAEEVVSLLQRRLGSEERATTVLPGDVIELQLGKRPQKYDQASPFIQAKALPQIKWEPIELSTLDGAIASEQKLVLQQKLEAFMAVPLALWLKRMVEQGNNALAEFRTQEVVWQLVVHVGEEKRLNYFIDFRSLDFAAKRGEHSQANFFTHISGQTLYEVFQGDVPGLIFWLTGSVRSYEKIMGVSDSHFWFPMLAEAPENQMSDPLTYYLRHFGTGELSTQEPDLPGIQFDIPSKTNTAKNTSQLHLNQVGKDIEILTREGGNRQVIAKKALLTYLRRARGRTY